MAGLYIHIPFCRSACHYCDFYFTVDTRRSAELVQAVVREIYDRKGELGGEEINSVYFGGGTPSVLTIGSIQEILGAIKECYMLNPDAEMTLEANPEDLQASYTKGLFESGINRLSIGIQSFREEDLQRLNRRHNGIQAVESVLLARQCGFTNISVDLMFGLPQLDSTALLQNLEQIHALDIPHFSAYHLTYESNTVLDYQRKKGRIQVADEEESLRQFRLVRNFALQHGYQHYEISNFAREGMYSRHNSAYWQGIRYLGFGPGAHSYTGEERRWNHSSLFGYLQHLQHSEPYWETEKLSEVDRYNELIITRIRTMWGIPEKAVKDSFNPSIRTHYEQQKQKLLNSGLIKEQESGVCLTEEGILVSDRITEAFIL